MKTNNTSQRRNRLTLLIFPMLLTVGLLLSGCSNDPVAPHEDPPELTAGDVASQSGRIAWAAALITPQTIDFAGKSEDNPYPHHFSSPLAGTAYLAYFIGGAEGTPVEPPVADYVNLYTAADAPIIATFGVSGAEGTIELTFDIEADLDRAADPDNATINGGGTFASGPYEATFTFSDLFVEKGAIYPGSGSMTVSSAGYSATLTYDGDNTAVLELSNGSFYLVDLGNNGTAVQFDPMLLPE